MAVTKTRKRASAKTTKSRKTTTSAAATKSAAKKTIVKKSAAKKTTAKNSSSAVKKAAAKSTSKTTARKSSAEKTTVKNSKATSKKPLAQKRKKSIVQKPEVVEAKIRTAIKASRKHKKAPIIEPVVEPAIDLAAATSPEPAAMIAPAATPETKSDYQMFFANLDTPAELEIQEPVNQTAADFELEFSFADLASDEEYTTKPQQNKTFHATFCAEYNSQEDTMINQKLQQLADRTATVEPSAPANDIPLANITDPIAAKYDVRNISSLQLTLMGNELFSAGRINREDLAMLAFQPELNRNYDTVGAMGVAKPDPNQPRNAIAEWQEILDNQLEFNCSPYFISQTRRVIDILKSIEIARYGE